jgi:hypothetical protein
MKYRTVGGYEIHLPTSGGKAGADLNKTSALQVRKDSCIVKQFKFAVGGDGFRKALEKAMVFCNAGG